MNFLFLLFLSPNSYFIRYEFKRLCLVIEKLLAKYSCRPKNKVEIIYFEFSGYPSSLC